MKTESARNQEEKLELVFVYGTLLSGEGNNGLLGSSKLLGPATTEEGFRMYSNGWFPYVTRMGTDESSYPVQGELWEVTPNTLHRLDMLEGVPSHYQRHTINVKLASDESVRSTYIYLYPRKPSGEEITSGSWKTHTQRAKGQASA